MSGLHNFELGREALFHKVVFKGYDCTEELQMIICNLNTHTTAFLEGLSARMFELLAQGSQSRIIQFLAENDLQEQDVNEFIQELVDQEVLNGKTEQIEGEQPQKETSGNTDYINFCEEIYQNGYLFNIHIDITNQCNLRCCHCYHPFEEYTQNKQITLKDIEEIIDESCDLGAFSVTFSGGEAFLRPDIFQALEYATRKKMVISIFTNATLIDGQMVEKLKLYNIDRIGVSLYSTDRDTHDSITTVSGSFDKTAGAIQALTKSDLQVEIRCMLMKGNFKRYKEMITTAKDWGCTLAFDISMAPKLNGDDSPMDLLLTSDQYRELCLDTESVYYADKVNGIKVDAPPCNAGRYGLYYDSAGNIHPCVGFPILLGTHKDKLQEIWESNPDLIKWRKMRNSDFTGYGKHSYCQHCIEICAGNALLENGDYTQCEKKDCFKARVRESAYKQLKGGLA
ncbi:MAG: radical SAM protein [Oscillospiraceae bacterium]|nr:radical SAM protein [Oscillospiraceae bacterium]